MAAFGAEPSVFHERRMAEVAPLPSFGMLPAKGSGGWKTDMAGLHPAVATYSVSEIMPARRNPS